MTKFIQLKHVVSDYTAKNFTRAKETTELVAINIDAIEHVGSARKSDNLVTIAKGYVRTKNCDFRVAETYEEITALIGRLNENG